MISIPRLADRAPGLLFVVGFALGIGVQGIDTAAVGGLLGYFLGKSIQSTVRTFSVAVER